MSKDSFLLLFSSNYPGLHHWWPWTMLESYHKSSLMQNKNVIAWIKNILVFTLGNNTAQKQFEQVQKDLQSPLSNVTLPTLDIKCLKIVLTCVCKYNNALTPWKLNFFLINYTHWNTLIPIYWLKKQGLLLRKYAIHMMLLTVME